jgi:hypothetical protein
MNRLATVWYDLASLSVKAASGTLALQDVVTIARLVVLANSQEKSAMEAIGHDVRALVQGPFNAAMLHLEDAQRDGRTKSERRESFQKCKDCLYQAHGQETTQLHRKVIISYYIAVCWIALGDAGAAHEWFSRAYDFLTTYAEKSQQYLNINVVFVGNIYTIPIALGIWAYCYYRRKSKIRGEVQPAGFADIIAALEKLRTTEQGRMLIASPNANQLDSIRWLAKLAHP